MLANEEHHQILNCLQQSITQDFQDFSLVYQPKVHAASTDSSYKSSIVAYEALTRWGNVRPDIFIYLAEHHGFIDDIGEWAIDEVLREINHINRPSSTPNQQVRFYINLSGKQVIRNGRFVKHLEKSLVYHGINPSMLGIELTETIAVSDIGCVKWMVDYLVSMGIRVALDDFGIGHSGIHKLQQLHVNEIKVDKSFLQVNCPRSMAILKYTLLMARDIGVEVVIEGVELESDLMKMLQMGAEYFQGYLFGKPKPLKDIFSTKHYAENASQRRESSLVFLDDYRT
jgi:EAL domain-containing protein (putative c-di-GMP-specific phosphodiesterase class I)